VWLSPALYFTVIEEEEEEEKCCCPELCFGLFCCLFRQQETYGPIKLL
jgi:hypothetical protein